MGRPKVYDNVGFWTVIKNELIERYAQRHTTIMSNQPWCAGFYYVDAFAGAEHYTLRDTGAVIPGGITRALAVEPKFTGYLLNDMDADRALALKHIGAVRDDVMAYQLDYEIFLNEVVVPFLPRSSRRRALVIIDPYKMGPSLDTIVRLGQLKTCEVLINLPSMDINRNVLRRTREAIPRDGAAKFTEIFGDNSWLEDSYKPSLQLPLFEALPDVKSVTNADIASAYVRQLKTRAGFSYVAPPLPMRNTRNSALYYLIFASHNRTGSAIIEYIFGKFGASMRS